MSLDTVHGSNGQSSPGHINHQPFHDNKLGRTSHVTKAIIQIWGFKGWPGLLVRSIFHGSLQNLCNTFYCQIQLEYNKLCNFSRCLWTQHKLARSCWKISKRWFRWGPHSGDCKDNESGPPRLPEINLVSLFGGVLDFLLWNFFCLDLFLFFFTISH